MSVDPASAPRPRESLPNWTWDETLLAWELYLAEYARREPAGRPRYPDASNAAVRTLSEELRSLPIHPADVRADPRFRNPAGVARKIQNLMWFATGRQYGSENGSALDERVASLLADPTTVRRYATTIRDVAPSLRDEPAEGEAEFTAEEGALLKRFHLDRERNSGAVRRKKQRALASGRPIECEVCGVDVASLYGVPDGSIIECHHRRPLAEGVRQTTLDDLALVCPSCHRALHRIQPWTTVEALRERVRGR